VTRHNRGTMHILGDSKYRYYNLPAPLEAALRNFGE
jgi:hypothetical protein